MHIKWVTLSIALIIIIVAAWFLFTPQSANSPDLREVTIEEVQDSASGTQLAGTDFEGVLDTDVAFDHQALLGESSSESEEVEDQVSDPIFHALVTYTDHGFTPNKTVIQKGETVRFVNQADNPVWVAGNNHPTHSEYPEKDIESCLGTSFDTCRGLQSGEFWEFTFDQVGKWGFHNHRVSSHTGIITVE